MNAKELLRELGRRRVTLTPHQAGIRCIGPRGAVTAEIKAELTRLKAAVLEALAPHPAVHGAIGAIETKALALGWDKDRLWGTGSKRPDLLGLAELLGPDETIAEVKVRYITLGKNGNTTRFYNMKAPQPWITCAGSTTELGAGSGAGHVAETPALTPAGRKDDNPAAPQADQAGIAVHPGSASPRPLAQDVRGDLPAVMPILSDDAR